ncbi:FadR/GntR family transcriptional regulator [Paenibacillus thermotolerans]|uniref:FadR/GntR family transcriptional regulator n=1 Tax=Paenibacillus thermotolerans TaxID=3027807 RepID=UPI002367AE70|nr:MULTISPECIES: FadR/GntR family transcriptional regulator [unclassified Paenibacillus]
MPQRPLKGYEWVSKELIGHISEGRYKPGDKLPSVVDLAVQYGVGRSTVREALSALKAKGLIDIRQGGGTYVLAEPAGDDASFTKEDWTARAESLRHIVEVRKVLETGCASLAAKHRTAEDLAAMRANLKETESRLNDEAFCVQADIELHSRIAEATNNPALVEMMASLSHLLQESMKDTRALWFYAERESAERLLAEHASIVDAIESGDETLAAAAMANHLNKVEQVLKEKTGSRNLDV